MERKPEYIRYRGYELCIQRKMASWQVRITPAQGGLVAPHPAMSVVTGRERDKSIAEAKRRVDGLYGE
jgi:hypothetical protein